MQAEKEREKNSQRTFWFLWGPELLCIFVFLTAGHALSILFILPGESPNASPLGRGGSGVKKLTWIGNRTARLSLLSAHPPPHTSLSLPRPLTAASGHGQPYGTSRAEKKEREKEGRGNGGLHFLFHVSDVHVSSNLKRHRKTRATTLVGCESSRRFVGVEVEREGGEGEKGGRTGARVTSTCRHAGVRWR